MRKRVSPTASYKGRITRSTFWQYIWPYLLIGMTAAMLDLVMGFGQQTGPMTLLVAVFIAIPTWRLMMKRAHDRNHSGLYLVLVSALPVIGGWWLFVELGLLAGTRGNNRFGPDPATAAG